MNSHSSLQRVLSWSSMAFAALGTGGCAGPPPDLFPPSPLAVNRLPDGRIERRYDLDRNGRADYLEQLGRDGRVAVMRFEANDNTEAALTVDQAALEGSGEARQLIILLDSIPHQMVDDLWRQGRFRLFHPPSRVISPFPAMTDLSFAEFFGISPSRAVEAQFYNGVRRNVGFDDYALSQNSPWVDYVDYHLPFAAHVLSYSQAAPWYDHELRRIQERFQTSRRERFLGYVVGTSALGARGGRNGHQTGLVRLDRFCQAIMHQARGNLHITLLSDHGHNLVRSRRIALTQSLSRFGYRVRDAIRQPMDVVVPQFGPVTCAAIYTRVPAAVARDVAGIEGVELTAYRDADEIVVLSRGARARIRRGADGYAYRDVLGDPLQLRPILDELARRGAMDANGVVPDDALFSATVAHVYPDPLHRLWRAFNGLVVYTPDVLISLSDGWHWGGATLSSAIDLAAAHGSLNRLSSTGFVLATAGSLPSAIRMEDLRATLRAIGVPVPGFDDDPPEAVDTTKTARVVIGNRQPRRAPH